MKRDACMRHGRGAGMSKDRKGWDWGPGVFIWLYGSLAWERPPCGTTVGVTEFLVVLEVVFLVHADPSPAFWCIMSGLVSGWTTLYFISERVLSSLLRGGAVLAAVLSHWQA